MCSWFCFFVNSSKAAGTWQNQTKTLVAEGAQGNPHENRMLVKTGLRVSVDSWGTLRTTVSLVFLSRYSTQTGLVPTRWTRCIEYISPMPRGCMSHNYQTQEPPRTTVINCPPSSPFPSFSVGQNYASQPSEAEPSPRKGAL